MNRYIGENYDLHRPVHVKCYENPEAERLWGLAQLRYVCRCERHDCYVYTGSHFHAMWNMSHPQAWCHDCYLEGLNEDDEEWA